LQCETKGKERKNIHVALVDSSDYGCLGEQRSQKWEIPYGRCHKVRYTARRGLVRNSVLLVKLQDVQIRTKPVELEE